MLDFAQCFRGGSFQKDIHTNKRQYKVLGGKEIQRYHIRGIKGYIDDADESAKIIKNSILAQEIIAHIENPIPHIKFTATIIDENMSQYKIVNTIFQIICNDNVSNRYILGLLHSKFINWYCYRFCFAKAIRSMDFSNEIATKIPIPKIDSNNEKLANKIISLVDKILESKRLDSTCDTKDFESQIDKLVYELYALDSKEIAIIES